MTTRTVRWGAGGFAARSPTGAVADKVSVGTLYNHIPALKEVRTSASPPTPGR
ncbi:hypothetical protein AB0M42_31310 [Streptomyces sp. NPDC051784]|uniref:hypothetical protein n=1 Tax=Streptomyces sp. NPDC051784 TaxID=3155805 RepID=UPI00344A9E1B